MNAANTAASSYAIYARQSSDQSGTGVAVARQISQCRDLAAKLALPGEPALYIDNDVSAMSGKPRPAYQRLLHALLSGQHATILAWHCDRIYRKNTDLEPLITVIEQTGVRIHCVQNSGDGEVDLTTPDGRMVARILGAVATREVEHKSQRQKAANRDRAARGQRSSGGPRPFGYGRTVEVNTVDPRTGAVTTRTTFVDLMNVNEPEAALIRDAYQAKLTGASDRSIVTGWNRQGIRTVQGKPWTGANFRWLIRRPALAGLFVHKGVLLDGVTGVWPAIVEPDVWHAVQAILTDPRRRTRTGPGRKSLLGGIARCRCGCVLESQVRPAGRGGQREYRCQQLRLGRAPGDTGAHVAILAHKLDTTVLDRAIDALAARDLTAPTVDSDTQTRLAGLHRALAAQRAREQRLAAALADDLISAQAATAQTQLIRRTTRALNADLNRAILDTIGAPLREDAATAVLLTRTTQPFGQRPRNRDGTYRSRTSAALADAVERNGAPGAEPVRAAALLPDDSVARAEFRALVGERFHRLPHDEQRATITALLSITVNPFHGDLDRIVIHPR